MTCAEISILFSPAVDEELSSGEERVFREHVASCDACRERFAQLRRLRVAFRQTAPAPSTARRRAIRTPVLPPAAAAAAVLAAAMVFLVMLLLDPVPPPVEVRASDSLVFLEIQSAEDPPPCSLPTDCSIEPDAPMP